MVFDREVIIQGTNDTSNQLVNAERFKTVYAGLQQQPFDILKPWFAGVTERERWYQQFYVYMQS